MFSIGSGDGEGTVVLLSPESVRPVIESFEKAYATASEVNKRVYERAALDIYEGIEHLRALQWLVIEIRRPVSEVYGIWGGFKAYLQDCVERVDNEGREYAKATVETEVEKRAIRRKERKLRRGWKRSKKLPMVGRKMRSWPRKPKFGERIKTRRFVLRSS